MANEKTLHELVKAGVWEIDSQGRIWNKDKGKRIERRQSHGYLQVSKKTNGVQIHTGAHRLVYHHFKGEIPHGMVINHINGIKGDNRPENLEVVTPSENMKHAFRTGLLNSKERHNARKLTNNQVSEIRETYAIGGGNSKTNCRQIRSVAFGNITDSQRGQEKSSRRANGRLHQSQREIRPKRGASCKLTPPSPNQPHKRAAVSF